MYYGEYELIIFYYMTLANYIILAIILYTVIYLAEFVNIYGQNHY